jgi:predicted Rossmann fold nucleotide-binding protein DprA/Smf involved in DNA uptake
MNKEAALLALMLSELPGVGDKVAARILARNRQRGHSLATFFRLPVAVLEDDYALPALTLSRLDAHRGEHEARCRWLLEQLTAAGGFVYMPEDAAYPARVLQRLVPPPSVLYGSGNLEVLRAPTLAVLNSRELREHSVSVSLAVVQAAAAQGFTLVGGGMKTAYRITAVASRAAAASRVVVLDRGCFATFGAHFDRDPFGFGPVRSRLDAARTLVLSPFRLLDHAAPRNGPRRDALVAALADVIVAVHARPGGGIERVCLAALDRGQSVLSWYGENRGLVAAGATAIEEADVEQGLARFLPR